VAVPEAKPPAPGQETRELADRASQGDQETVPAIRALLADGDRGRLHREAYGSPAAWLRETVIGQAAGKSVIIREAMYHELDAIRMELAGPDPTPLERLLADRAATCWLSVNRYEHSFHKMKDMTLAQAAFHQRKIDRAHARFLTAVRTLAQVRKLALPALQINVARNQVNVTESRS
jgi:hypothetical protein